MKKHSTKKSKPKRGRTKDGTVRTFAARLKKRHLIPAISIPVLTAIVLISLVFGTFPSSSAVFYNSVIRFGLYPQTRVTSEPLLKALNAADPEWKTYDDCYTGGNYYGTMQKSFSMKYADITYNEERYRAVVFDEYRPSSVLDPADMEHSFQDDNGYLPGNVYWFRWEPIRWIITDDKKQLLLSEKILDAVQFNDSFYWIDRDKDTEIDLRTEFSTLKNLELPANIYKTSTIRRWLNEDFLSAAFGTEDRKRIKSTLHNASESNKNVRYGLHSVTSDKVWLMSAAEVLACHDSGLSEEQLFPDATDYAKCRGAFSGYFDGRGSAWWWTRSPGDFSGDIISIADNEMIISFDRQFFSAYTVGGIRCALRLRSTYEADDVE